VSDETFARGIPWRERLRAAASVVKRLAGMPDYDRYLAHLRESHPERPVPTEREYYQEFVKGRYEDGSSRCC